MVKNTVENSAHVKAHNRGVVLKLICSEKILTRVDISRKTGLAKMTVTNIINEFIDMGYIKESKPCSTLKAGRNPIGLVLQESSPKVLGINISKEHLCAVLCDIRLNVVESYELDNAYAKEHGFMAAVEKLIEYFEHSLARILAIGISTTGVVDAEHQVYVTSFDFPEVDNLELGKIIREKYNVPCVINNDTKSSALCEKLFGKGKEYNNFIHLCITNGIGSGIVCDGELYMGQNGYIGELGHTSIDYKGNPCRCGNRGCLDTYISTEFIEKQLRYVTGKNLTFAQFCGIDDDEKVDMVFEDMLDKLACALVSQINMLNPGCIIVGDNGAFFSDKHLSYLENQINKRKLLGDFCHIPVLRSAFLDKAALMGSVCLVLDKLFKGESFETQPK